MGHEAGLALRLFGAQVLHYALICISLRAVASGHYLQIAVADALVATTVYYVIRRVATSDSSVLMWLAYTTGGVLGSLLGTYVSEVWL